MNQPRCSACNHDKTRSVRTEGPNTAEEVSGQASRVEVYQCPACGVFTRFPRYNDPVKLLDTRTGRCGEWANCFTLCCRAMGFEARYALDVTDHVWTEVYSEHFKRWLHCDSCEDQLDCPLTYEVGWGKKLSYIFSFAHDEVVDTARRYTQNWGEMSSRRQDVSEKWLEMTISQINRGLRDQQTPERVAILTARAKSEQEELLRGRSVKSTEVKGRVSGSAEWKNQRSEDGGEEIKSDSVPTSATQKPGHRLMFTPTTQILQELCRNMVVGCQPQNANCTNPFCLIGRTTATSLDVSSDVNKRAAQAIQVMTALSTKGFSSESLAVLRCPVKSTELRWFLWKNYPLVYLPLQDPPPADHNVPLIDISGHDNHAENVQRCSLRKPFRIPNSGRAVSEDGGECQRDDETYGMQLLEGQHVSIPVKRISSSTGYALSFLVRLDQDTVRDAKKTGVCSVLTARLDTSGSTSLVVFCVFWNYSERHFTCELHTPNEAPQTTVCAGSVLAFGLYAHVAIMQTKSEVVAYINGMRMGQFAITAGEVNISAGDQVVTLEGPTGDTSSTAAVISHVAVLPTQSSKEVEELCAVMKKTFVAAPPLKAFGSNGERSSERCLEKAAETQSGYRVSRVLSTSSCHRYVDAGMI
ncbi:hypothetical protein BBO99_00003217 [Phytophthora kernoviae]|uniref:Transglutaminase-like domain-containing protein n=2 Tax=Phytophthora kernoviae TaxID=325452 RepID=A0A3R7J9B0_9STRA|nr:hypothetical protein G195_004789 [Phytophthora kernoviae 00238/432]KAG2525260.1 hypothetical protein JM16_003231 [Phytophthora kernoviae]KAG2526951.1 hypothetical protein JM18_003335 [Phytophthora kernoviae]RLN10988.1 hypothetical protein BBI17_000729 [Phytophthora kernoviae]RLN82048.1 hypothetical protein BBO99_00003217 [Phytophthora kernoviae]